MGEDRPDFQRRQDIAAESGIDVEPEVEVRNSGLDTNETEIVEFGPDPGFTFELVDVFFDVSEPGGSGFHGIRVSNGGSFLGGLLFAQSTASGRLRFEFGRWVEFDQEANPPPSTDPLAYNRVSSQVIQPGERLQFFYTNSASQETFEQRTYSALFLKRRLDAGA